MSDGYLTKAQILESDDLPTDEVDVPEWGGKVLVRPMSATERDRFELTMRLARDDPDNAQIRAQMAGRCIVDKKGKRLFSDKELGQLGSKSARALDRVVDKIRAMSGMTPEALDQAAESFDEAPSDSSSTD